MRSDQSAGSTVVRGTVPMKRIEVARGTTRREAIDNGKKQSTSAL